MIPAGYMAKRVLTNPDWLRAPNVVDVFCVTNCVSENFADYISYWKHNGYWLFDSPELIRAVARESSTALDDTRLFYYEIYEFEYDGTTWKSFVPEHSISTEVLLPSTKQLEGFDVANFFARSSPECSPLACNLMAKEIPTNSHCLLVSLEEAKQILEDGLFKDCEPGPYRIFAVHSVEWDSCGAAMSLS